MKLLEPPKPSPPRPRVGAILLFGGNLGLVLLNWWLWAHR
jgi:hypothetical protein